jgi:sulfur carrier protein ThiS
MKVRVRLFGTLGERFPGYRPTQGVEVEIPDRATVKDLLTHLGIPESQRPTVIVEGRILKADDRMQDGVPVSIMQTISGG